MEKKAMSTRQSNIELLRIFAMLIITLIMYIV